MIQEYLNQLPADKHSTFKSMYTKRKKSLLTGYVCLVLAIHYGYTRKWGMQIFFWFTFGGVFIWWFIDFFRLPSIINAFNREVAGKIVQEMAALQSLHNTPV